MSNVLIQLQPLFLTKEEAADYLRLSVSTLETLVARGEAPPPRTTSARRVCWLVEELTEWGRSRPVSELLPPANTGKRQAA